MNCFCAYPSVILAFIYLSIPKLRDSGNKHQNNPLVGAETAQHLSAYIIL